MTTTARRGRKSAGLTDVGFWQRFWSRFTGRPRLAVGEASEPYNGDGAITPESALELSALFACVGLRVRSIASLPFHLLDANKKPATGHPLYRILHAEPNADMSAAEWMQSQVAGIDLWGNGHSRIHRTDKRDRVVALEPFASSDIRVRRTVTGIAYERTVGGKVEIYSADDILHFKGLTLDGLVGLSPIQYAADVLVAQQDADRKARREWNSGLSIGGFVKMKTTNKPEQDKQLLERFAAFNKPENTGRWMPIDTTMEPVPLAGNMRINPNDAQLLESRGFGIEEICRFYGVPPALIGHMDKASSWAASLESLDRALMKYSLRPTIVGIEQACARKLLSPVERRAFTPRINIKGFLRADSKAQSEYYHAALQDGHLNIDEVRDLEDLPPLPDGAGQRHTIQLNLVDVAKLPDPVQTPAPAPTPAP